MSKVKKDLLTNAIADAKAVRETALKNAKLALEEAFTPKLQSMLSAKLQKEVEGDDYEDDEEDVDVNIETGNEEDVDIEDNEIEEDEDVDINNDEENINNDEENIDIENDEIEEDEDVDLDIEDDEISEEEDVDVDIEDEDNLDLESIIKELEGEEDVDLDIKDDEIDEDEDVDLDIEDDEDVNIEEDEDVDLDVEDDDDDEDVEISMQELYSALREMDGEEEAGETNNLESEKQIETLEQEKDELEKELGEAYKVIKFMKNKINEVNLINAKLLFTTKLFKAFDLDENAKVKVVETLDRAQNAREAKLVFVTLAESYAKATKKVVVGKSVKKLTEQMSTASKAQPSTKPKQIIAEGNEMVDRFQKLANINSKKN